jgi:GTP-binding protein
MTLLAEQFGFMSWAKVQTCCATSGYNFSSIFPTIFELASQLDVTIPTALVNRVVNDALLRMPAPVAGRGRFKVLYSVHKGNRPPTFILFANSKAGAKSNYMSYLEGQLRRAFGLDGLPMRLEVRVRREPEDRATERRARVKKQARTPEGKAATRLRDKRNKRRGR